MPKQSAEQVLSSSIMSRKTDIESLLPMMVYWAAGMPWTHFGPPTGQMVNGFYECVYGLLMAPISSDATAIGAPGYVLCGSAADAGLLSEDLERMLGAQVWPASSLHIV